MMAKDLVTIERHALTPAQFDDLGDVPPSLNGSPISLFHRSRGLSPRPAIASEAVPSDAFIIATSVTRSLC
jgi:hypothetical protein